MTTGRINQVTNVSRCDTSGCLRGEHAIVSKRLLNNRSFDRRATPA